MAAVLQYQIRVNGGLLFSSTSFNKSNKRFMKAKTDNPDRIVELNEVRLIAKTKPALVEPQTNP